MPEDFAPTAELFHDAAEAVDVNVTNGHVFSICEVLTRFRCVGAIADERKVCQHRVTPAPETTQAGIGIASVPRRLLLDP